MELAGFVNDWGKMPCRRRAALAKHSAPAGPAQMPRTQAGGPSCCVTDCGEMSPKRAALATHSAPAGPTHTQRTPPGSYASYRRPVAQPARSASAQEMVGEPSHTAPL